MANGLFTVFVELGGGTYVGQVHVPNATDAFEQWIETQTDTDLAAWRTTREELLEVAATHKAIALNGISNVWCLSASIGAGLLLANIVLTEKPRGSEA